MHYNTNAIEKVLSNLLANTDLLVSNEYPLTLGDFATKIYKAIYSAIYNTFVAGNSEMDYHDLLNYFEQNQSMITRFKADGGLAILEKICKDTNTINFDFYYKTVKKYALLNDLEAQGFNITDIYNTQLNASDFEKQLAIFNAMTVDDIFKYFNTKLNKTKVKYDTFLEKTSTTAGAGMREFYKSLQESPDIGLPLDGDIYNTITRGARLKKLYIDSGATGSGKSRKMAGNATKLSIPLYYNTDTQEWESTGMNNKVLYITTELEHNEIRSLVLAYLTGIDEDKILFNMLSQEERERLEMAVTYVENNDNLHIEYLPNPSIQSVTTIFKKYALQYDVKYVFYDYIHISPSMMMNRDNQTRDDILLLMLAETLKHLGNECDVHVSTATQLSGDWMGAEVKNQNLLRGARSIADKADIAMITLPCLPAEADLGAAIAAQMGTKIPNSITDVYKNRRGKWTSVRIWRYVDLSTCRAEDCFLTDLKNNPIPFNVMKIKLKQAVKTEVSVMGFDPDTGEVIRKEE